MTNDKLYDTGPLSYIMLIVDDCLLSHVH